MRTATYSAKLLAAIASPWTGQRSHRAVNIARFHFHAAYVHTLVLSVGRFGWSAQTCIIQYEMYARTAQSSYLLLTANAETSKDALKHNAHDIE